MTANTHEKIRQLCRNFKNWAQQNVETGIDGHGAKTDYVPYPKLQSYWTHDRIGTILGHHEKDVDIDKVQYRFIQVVSVLTYISDDSHILTEYLVDFYRTDVDDHSLPLPTPNERLNRIPPPFHDDPVGPQVWRQFSGHQWKFLPLHFEPKEGVIDRIHPLRTLDPRHIIPITIESELSRRSGRGARVVKAQPHEASGLSSEFIVLKIYDRERYFDEFMKERNTYTTIRNMRRIATMNVYKYFLRYHGCYIQGNNCVLLIEYANQGSLLEFFHKNWYLPRTKDEAQDLWIELGQLFKGLALLHNGGKHNSSIHQDIKPANIFVSETSSNGKHSLCFKFGDFGTSSVTPIAENGDTTGHDNGGTKMYSAPELCGLDPDVHMAERITWQADIWSFGCVLLDCGVWMTMHERGRIQFRKERVEEARSLRQNSLSMAGYSGAFHDGEQVLSTVRHKIDEVRQLDSPMSRLVAKIMTFVQEEMLLADIVARLTAQQLQARFEARFQDAVNNPMNLSSPGMSRIPSQVMRYSMSPCRTSTGPGWDTISYRGKGKEIATWQGGFPESATWDSEPRVADDDRESGRISLQPSMGRSLTMPYQERPLPSASPSNHPGRSEFQQPSLIDLDYRTDEALKPAQDPNGQEDLLDSINSVLEWIPKRKVAPRQTLEWLVQPLKQVRGRDQCFIFDNSASMAPYWADVKRTGDALTYILKNADPDGFEIHMTNSGEPMKRNNRNGLFDRFGYFDQHTPRPDMGPCAMETVLSNILGAVVKKATAPSSRLNLRKSRQIQGVSVYVFTNGVWENSPSSRDGSFGEAGGVENAIKTAVKSLQDANRMRTFLSIQFISFGDNPEGRRRMSWLDDGIKNMTGGWDIVDTTHHTGSVRKMIIGAISDSVDNG